MRKLILLALAGILYISNTSAQIPQILHDLTTDAPAEKDAILRKNSQVIHVGYGFPNNIASYLSLGGIGGLLSSSSSTKQSGPVFISYEYFVKNRIGLGLSLSYAQATQTYTGLIGLGNVQAHISGFSILGSYIRHLKTAAKYDVYMKGSIGVNLWDGYYKNADGTTYKEFKAPTPVAYQAMLGGRYFLNERIAPFAELSYSTLKFTGNLGIAYKLK